MIDKKPPPMTEEELAELRRLELEMQDVGGLYPREEDKLELIQTVAERAPSVADTVKNEKVKWGGEMLLAPEERADYHRAKEVADTDYSGDTAGNVPRRDRDEPFSEFSRRLQDYAAKKALYGELQSPTSNEG